MRIISKFRDYYDIHANAKDDVPVYLRESHDVGLVLRQESGVTEQGRALGPMLDWIARAPRFPSIRVEHDRYANRTEVVIFTVALVAGRVYPEWTWFGWPFVTRPIDPPAPPAMSQASDVVATLIRYAGKKESETIRERWDADESIHHEDTYSRLSPVSGRPMEPHFVASRKGFEAWLAAVPDATVWHRHFDAPVLAIHPDRKGYQNDHVTVNPSLRECMPSIAKLLPPTRAYQEIDLYLGSTLAKQIDPVPERTQDLIRDQKGFDKWSFKTRPR